MQSRESLSSEQFGSKGTGTCVNTSGSLPCHVPDEQIGLIMEALVLPKSGQDRLLAKIHLTDEVSRVEKERKKLTNRPKRLGQVYMDELFEYEDYCRQKMQYEDQLLRL